MDKFKTKIKQIWEEQPIVIITAVATTASVLLKAVEVTNETRNSRTWAKEVKRRSRNDD